MIFSLLRSLLLHEEEGATALEYGLICSLIFLVIIASVTAFATETTNMWMMISSNI